ncbi:hypothetical protein ACIP4S_13255 [Streptomyces chartreusis]|uniref:hypothetical protein n=1 Tax=Streptomyces chartreusis TaxID=1969 RepID=UPI0037F521DC
MKVAVRADVVELLRAGGLSQAEIARRTGASPLTVQRTREYLKLPAPKQGQHPLKHPTQDAAFWACTRPAADGHLTWTGRVAGTGTPVLRYRDTQESAYRIAFHLHYGRQPVGRVLAQCDVPLCVAGRCLADRTVRAANARADAAFDEIFGSDAAPTDNHEPPQGD